MPIPYLLTYFSHHIFSSMHSENCQGEEQSSDVTLALWGFRCCCVKMVNVKAFIYHLKPCTLHNISPFTLKQSLQKLPYDKLISFQLI